MKKAFIKRFKITKKGKILYRRAGHNHFNAKESSKLQRRHKKMQTLPKSVEKKMKKYLATSI